MDRWNRTDRDKVLAYRRWESDRCPQCGTFPADWLDEHGRILPDPPFVAEVIGCQGCREIAELQEQLDEEKDPGRRVHLVVAPLHPAD